MAGEIRTPDVTASRKFSESFPRRIAVLGSNACAWMSAAMLARNMQGLNTEISVFSGDRDERTPFRAIWTSTTLPTVVSRLGVDEQELLRSCQGTFRLATRFSHWAPAGHDFVHPVSDDRQSPGIRSLYDNWQIQRSRDISLAPLHQFVAHGPAAANGCSPHSFSGNSPLADPTQYGYHIDSVKLSDWFRKVAVASNVREWTDEVLEFSKDSEGRTTALRVASGQTVSVDFVLDCRQTTTKRRQQTTPDWIDLSNRFHCDRVVRQNYHGERHVPSMTEVCGLEYGWATLVPLQNEVEAQYAFSSSMLSDEAALQELRSFVSTTMQTDAADNNSPHFSDVVHGRCAEAWRHNVVRLGPAAFEVEPIAAASFHLAVVQVELLLDLLTDYPSDAVIRVEYYNRMGSIVDETIDYAQLHQILRDPTELQYATETLRQTLAVYDANGSIPVRNTESPSELQWAFLLTGAGRMPVNSSWELRQVNADEVERKLRSVLAFNEAVIRDLPRHEEILDWIHSAPLSREAG